MAMSGQCTSMTPSRLLHPTQTKRWLSANRPSCTGSTRSLCCARCFSAGEANTAQQKGRLSSGTDR
eukprot:37353-Eustigmatos_ZCMA.PRE.1